MFRAVSFQHEYAAWLQGSHNALVQCRPNSYRHMAPDGDDGVPTAFRRCSAKVPVFQVGYVRGNAHALLSRQKLRLLQPHRRLVHGRHRMATLRQEHRVAALALAEAQHMALTRQQGLYLTQEVVGCRAVIKACRGIAAVPSIFGASIH